MSSSLEAFWRDPALPWIESRRACHSRACYKAHSHPTYSIGAVDCGSSRFEGAGTCSERLTPGTLVFVPAHCLHACNPDPGCAWSYQMLHLDAAWLEALHEEWRADLPRVADGVCIARAPALYQRFCALNDLLFSKATKHDKETAVIEFLGDHDLSRLALPASPPLPVLDSEKLHALLAHMNGDRLDLPLADLAHLVGMGRYQLIRAFRQATGFTPHAYQLNARINRARAWLREGRPLADVAYRLGFADQSHFQRVFKAHTGVTPGLYRTAGAQ
ncbi:AraC family transcriptional regulator [Pseudomonas entomophila]|uniref:AraC family transcriptional regulator n=1 Tax=Pseudomonas entomophila TaxID=312306 RepID=UPI003EB77A59